MTTVQKKTAEGKNSYELSNWKVKVMIYIYIIYTWYTGIYRARSSRVGKLSVASRSILYYWLFVFLPNRISETNTLVSLGLPSS